MVNKQNGSKVLVTIIVLLLATNIAMVYFLMKKDNGRPEKRPDRKTVIADFLKKEIGFTPEQLQQYDTLSDRHRENIKKMFEDLRSSKESQFRQLAAGEFSDSIMNSVADQSSSSQKIMELQMFGHLKKIRMLCTPDQLPKFDSLFGKILNRRGGEARKKQVK